VRGKAEVVVDGVDFEWDGETDVESEDGLSGDGKSRAKTRIIKS
jgi:hypothetical protein